MKRSEVKIRYFPEEIKILEERAKKVNKSVYEYQKDISKKAKVKIEIDNE